MDVSGKIDVGKHLGNIKITVAKGKNAINIVAVQTVLPNKGAMHETMNDQKQNFERVEKQFDTSVTHFDVLCRFNDIVNLTLIESNFDVAFRRTLSSAGSDRNGKVNYKHYRPFGHLVLKNLR